MKKLLPHDCTLRSLAPGLRNAPEFVRAVFANMAGHQRDCQVRIALDTASFRPDYRIEFFIYDDIDGEEVAFPQTAAEFKGARHIEIAYETADLLRPWSVTAMKHNEVRQLHGELRGILPSA